MGENNGDDPELPEIEVELTEERAMQIVAEALNTPQCASCLSLCENWMPYCSDCGAQNPNYTAGDFARHHERTLEETQRAAGCNTGHLPALADPHLTEKHCMYCGGKYRP